MAMKVIEKQETNEKRFNLIFTKEEYEMLSEISKLTNRSKTSTVKMLVRYGHKYFVKNENMPDRDKEVA